MFVQSGKGGQKVCKRVLCIQRPLSYEQMASDHVHCTAPSGLAVICTLLWLDGLRPWVTWQGPRAANTISVSLEDNLFDTLVASTYLDVTQYSPATYHLLMMVSGAKAATWNLLPTPAQLGLNFPMIWPWWRKEILYVRTHTHTHQCTPFSFQLPLRDYHILRQTLVHLGKMLPRSIAAKLAMIMKVWLKSGGWTSGSLLGVSEWMKDRCRCLWTRTREGEQQQTSTFVRS